MSGMAEVLAAHRTIDVALYPDYYCCSCGHKGLEQPSIHQAAMLAAAGFGDLKSAIPRLALMAYDELEENALAEAKAQALEEAADAPLPAPKNGQTSGFRYWLRARAAAVRSDG